MSEIRNPVTHNLKIWAEHYSAVCAGVKRAELRKNDRDYRAGDTLDLCEWDGDDESFTGEFISVTVTHVADVSDWMPGYVLLSIELALRERAEPVYQCMEDGNWYDTEKRLYDEVKENGNMCRVLYTAPPAPVVPDKCGCWYLVSWRYPGGRYGSTEIRLDGPWSTGSMRSAAKMIADYNDLVRANVVILSVFPIAAAPGKN
ncbi:DUF3850 domain-containing protein [Cronobacter sakazakii]|uniref:DUF3850 domain-containing protein n=1 Tax=Cronobacter sakazakii TaxID=28141 RepID=UPI0021A43D77|nr:DUF3850 domain-containing protein [Cronobacter sakazakii]UWT86386.1 DUF3850 domain-containing protein [Cronobacter sakazakii]